MNQEGWVTFFEAEMECENDYFTKNGENDFDKIHL